MTRPRLLPLLAASPPFLLALLIGKLWLTGTLAYYVNSRTIWVVLAGGMLFAVVGLASIRGALHTGGAAHLTRNTLVFLIPILLGLFLPARPLSANSGQASSLGSLQLASHVTSGDPGDLFGSWVAALGQHPDASWWQGQHVQLVGFAAHQSGLPPRSFIVGRYLVTCCVVDATLMGFPVQLDHGPTPAEGAWVQISGVFGSHYWTDPSGAQYPVIERAQVVPARIPSSPYLNP